MFVVACLIGALVAALVSYLINQLPPIRNQSRPIRAVIVFGVVALCVASAVIIQWQVDLDEFDQPMAVIQSPADGSRIDRPQEVRVELERALPKGHTLWLAYQNELGGPYIVQASRCLISRRNADCGPVYVGQDEHDRSAFKLLLMVADTQATSILTEQGAGAAPGDNVSRAGMPEGAEAVSVIRHVVLAAAQGVPYSQ